MYDPTSIFLQELDNYEKELNTKVISVLLSANIKDGERAFNDWSRNLYNFLSAYTPSNAENFSKKVQAITFQRKSRKSAYDIYRSTVGDWIDIFLKNLRINPPTEEIQVFVVHGRNNKANNAVYEFLESLDIKALPFEQARERTQKPNPFIGEILSVAFSSVKAIVVIFTPDENVKLRKELIKEDDPPNEKEPGYQPRPNVLFEAGMAAGISYGRTLIIEIGTIRPFSDISGRHILRMDDSREKREAFINRLINAGCIVNTDGDKWLHAGKFNDAII